jgi:Lon-like protease
LSVVVGDLGGRGRLGGLLGCGLAMSEGFGSSEGDAENPADREDVEGEKQGQDDEGGHRLILDQMGEFPPSLRRGGLIGGPGGGRPRSRIFRTVVVAVVAGTLAAGAFTVPIKAFLEIRPGPAPDVEKLIQIPGTRTYTSAGSLHLTTVTLFEATLFETLRGWVDPKVAIVPREAIYPPGKSQKEVDRETATQMDDSEYEATVAALRQLDYKLTEDGALVRQTQSGTPAAAVIRAADVIVAVDGDKVASRDQLKDLIGRHKAGETVDVTVRRSGESKTFTIKVAEGGAGIKQPIIGVEVVQNFSLPLDVKIDAKGIGGPSAGFMFALGVVDLLTPEDITGGRPIAGTGTIDADGNIGAVGGVTQKVFGAEAAGARYFLAPPAEAPEARRAAGSKLKVIAVATLSQALAALRSISGGSQPLAYAAARRGGLLLPPEPPL